MKNISACVEQLLSQMTLEEKAAQMLQVDYKAYGRKEALKWAKRGAGSFLYAMGDQVKELQEAVRSSRLGIPAIFAIDAIHGHTLNDQATLFPTQLAAACSWNPDLMQKIGRAVAKEVAADGVHWTFSPVLCLARDSRWGRTGETFGEDAYLAGELGSAMIRGYQGDALDQPDSILACAKHFIGYGEATGARDACDTEMTYRKMRDVFLPPFQKAVDAGCATFMTAYGSIDGTPFTCDRKALHDILRDEMGFEGVLVTDWNNVTSLVTRQHVAPNLKAASVMAASAGNDLMMATAGYVDAIIEAVREGQMDETVLDEAVRRILTMKAQMGLLDGRAVPEDTTGCAAHQSLALEAARGSVTLLRNRGVLPLDKPRKVAVIGPNANDLRAQVGDWSYFTHPAFDLAHQPRHPYTTLWDGVRSICDARQIECCYHPGCSVTHAADDDIAAAVQAASDADVIILAVGDGLGQFGEGRDRADLSLSGKQEELFRSLRALGIPLITVLVASKPLCITDIAEQSDAVLCAFSGGMFSGTAMAEVLFGLVEPSGRLPISFPRHSGQLPVYYNHLDGWHSTAAEVDAHYCDLPGQAPLFVFGEGMAYTDFTYSDLSVDAATLQAAVTVQNTGKRTGTETVQLYFRDEVSSVMTPLKQLIRFKKVTLAPGESQRVTFQLTREDLSFVAPDERRITEPGGFTLMAGHSAKDCDLITTQFELKE